ncbi:hypothetical protein [Rhizobium sp. RU35A]|uniref:hypothetical protein n=1 Tax=Rhizobium sp. RU35A TaxID=1907414 RepID=UPI00122C7675|nr:hypothetical protein [Rhizobium sp. RU35A]
MNRDLSRLVEDADLGRCMRQLLEMGLSLPGSVRIDVAHLAYGAALSGLSVLALEAVTLRLMRGEYDRHLTFLPNPPELAALVRERQLAMRNDLRRLEETRRALVDLRHMRQAPQKTEAEKARVRALVRRATSELRVHQPTEDQHIGGRMLAQNRFVEGVQRIAGTDPIGDPTLVDVQESRHPGSDCGGAD